MVFVCVCFCFCFLQREESKTVRFFKALLDSQKQLEVAGRSRFLKGMREKETSPGRKAAEKSVGDAELRADMLSERRHLALL